MHGVMELVLMSIARRLLEGIELGTHKIRRILLGTVSG